MTVSVKSTRLFQAHTKRIISPVTVEASIELGFGVCVTKRICLDGDMVIDDKSWEAAKHCFVVMLGKKTFLTVLDMTTTHPHVVNALVYIEAKNAPEELVEVIEGQRLLNVGKYMRWLSESKPGPFCIRRVYEHVNGKGQSQEIAK